MVVTSICIIHLHLYYARSGDNMHDPSLVSVWLDSFSNFRLKSTNLFAATVCIEISYTRRQLLVSISSLEMIPNQQMQTETSDQSAKSFSVSSSCRSDC